MKQPVLDPYWRWAQLTKYRYMHGKNGEIRMLLAPRSGRIRMGLEGLKVCPAAKGRWVSARLKKPTPKQLSGLLKLADFVLAQPGMKPVGATNEDPPPVNGEKEEPRVLGKAVVVGVIDGRCGFANRAFCKSDTESHVDHFWDQGGAPVSPWKSPAEFDYGRVLDRATLNRQLNKHASAEAVSRQGDRAGAERALYRELGHRLPDDADWSHGTHVLDTVLKACLVDGAKDNQIGADGPGVIYVQLPDKALRDTSARWAASYVLDAIHYILARAGDAHVVVNLSLGSFAGPHDGSSPLERAIDELIHELHGRLTVVVAAGNAGRVFDDGTRRVVPCHARATLNAGHAPEGEDLKKSVELEWDISAADTTDSFMEIWIAEREFEGVHSSVSVSLLHAGANGVTGTLELAHAGPGKVGKWCSSRGAVMAALINATGARQVPNGKGGMVLVALGHTRDTAGPAAPTGRWIVKVSNESPWPITLDAWIERRDVPGDLAGFRPQYGFREASAQPTNKGSLGSLANGRSTIVVGAAVRDSENDPYRASDYSSVGVDETGEGCNARAVSRLGPDVFCEGEQTAAGFLSGSQKSLRGTSMAAAQVSGAIASMLLARAPEGHKLCREALLDALRRCAVDRRSAKSPERAHGQQKGGLGGTPKEGRTEAGDLLRTGFMLPPLNNDDDTAQRVPSELTSGASNGRDDGIREQQHAQADKTSPQTRSTVSDGAGFESRTARTPVLAAPRQARRSRVAPIEPTSDP